MIDWFSVYGNDSLLEVKATVRVFSLDTHLLLKYHHVNELKGLGWIYSGILPSLVREEPHCAARSISASFLFAAEISVSSSNDRRIQSHWLRSHRRRRERALKCPGVIHFQCEPAARAARRVSDGESVEESWNQVNFMVMSYDTVGPKPIRT